MKKYFLFLLLALPLPLLAQFGVGQWRDHLPYGTTIDVCDAGNIIYAATPYSVFGLDKTDNSINRLSKVEGLSESEVSAINYNKEKEVLVIGYLNGNIDLVFNHTQIVNVADVKNSSILADKRINNIYFKENLVYLSCGFGIVVIDTERRETKETYILGFGNTFVNVQDLLEIDGEWFAATDQGVYTASVDNPFLISFESWEQTVEVPIVDANYKNIEINSNFIYLFIEEEPLNRIFIKERIPDASWVEWSDYASEPYKDIYVDETVIMLQDPTKLYIYDLEYNLLHERQSMLGAFVRSNTSIRDSEGLFWVADNNAGLLGENFIDRFYKAQPEGPFKRSVRKIDAYNNNIWIAAGGIDASYTSLWNGEGAFGLVNGDWKLVKDYEFAVLPDMMDVAVNPTDNSEVFIGTWHDGLVRVKDNQIAELYDENNSSLEVTNYEDIDRIGVGVVTFDVDGNLWFSAQNDNEVLHVRTASGTFAAYDLSPFYDETDFIVDILASQRGFIYVITRDNGMIALDHKGTLTDTSDDTFKRLTTDEGNGGLPSERLLSIEEDLDGEIWVGTEAGPAVLYSQEAIFGEGNFDAQQIFITQDGNVQILLETEAITALRIDGGNRKWVGTRSSGVYVFSPDGLEQVRHFTVNNSPLFSNTINDIDINYETGEVFIGTESGLIGFKDDATNFYDDMEDLIKVFPNPVRPDFDGLISIDNLSKDVDVKITDISGNVMYQTIANGGRATWDGRDFNGQKVATGVYLVFATTELGESTAVTKIAFIN